MEIKNRKRKDMINLNPLQTGGKLPIESRDILMEYCDGYSVCDYCNGSLYEIKKPPIKEFIEEELPQFLKCSHVLLTHGAREGKYLLFNQLFKKGDKIIVDSNCHYSTRIAAEYAGVDLIEIPNNGHPNFSIIMDDIENIIDNNKPQGIFITYPDGEYGNFPSIKNVEKLSKSNDLISIINGAYSIGRMPMDINKLKVDFLIGSGHKSMSSSGPIGLVGFNEEYGNILLRKSNTNNKKLLLDLGCSVRGSPLITLMASFNHVKQRILKWDEEINKARYLQKEIEKISQRGIFLIGQNPHNHDLMKFESPLIYEISKQHKHKREVLYKHLQKHNITGIKNGRTKSFKISSYQISYNEIEYIIEVFQKLINDTE